MKRKLLWIIAAVLLAVGVAVVILLIVQNANSRSVSSPEAETASCEPSVPVISALSSDTATKAYDSLPQTASSDTDPVFLRQITSTRFSVSSVVDGVTGEGIPPRVALGASYGENYLSFYEDGTFELSLGSQDIKRGAFTLFGDVISILYDDGKGAEFRMITDTAASVTSVMVPYGEYQVFFS